jgi:dynein heavy chain
MRAVKSVLTAAGNLKRKHIDQNESEVMLRAIKDVNLAKFLAHDLPLFKNITSDLFPGVVLPEPDYESMISCINKQLKIKNLEGPAYFMEKIIQLYEMITVRHGLMVVGDPFAGKTSAITVLAGALTELKELGLMEEMKTHV